MRGVQVGSAFVEERYRRVVALPQPGGVVLVEQGEAADAPVAGKGQFLLGTPDGLCIVQCLQHMGADVRATFGQLAAEAEHVGSASYRLNQLFGSNAADAVRQR